MEDDDSDSIEGTAIIQEIINHGLKTGDVNNPELTQRLSEYLHRDKKASTNAKKRLSGAFKLRSKPKDKNKRREKVRGMAKSSDSSSSREELSTVMGLKETPFMASLNPTIISSMAKMPLPDDARVYDEEIPSLESGEEGCETSDDRALIEKFKQVTITVALQSKEKAVHELKQYIERQAYSTQILHNKAWLSLFCMTNANEWLTEEDVRNILMSYTI